ncbi:Dyp-type peroxidase [Pseudomonadota bacterium]
MKSVQPGILAPVPRLARYLSYSLIPNVDPRSALASLSKSADGDQVVVGIGPSLLLTLAAEINGLVPFPNYVGDGIEIPSTQNSLWCWIRTGDRGDHVHRTREISDLLADAFFCVDIVDAFQYGPSLDLTGYEDGTENPEGAEGLNAAIVQNQGAGLDGSSYVAVQQWVHDLDRFQAMSQTEQDNTIGRQISDNEELDDAPESAHVKRTAQEDFDPEAFILRRSMPWADASNEGLQFVAFGKSFYAFDAQLKRMLGMDDGITDALFNFTTPISGSYYWCPPLAAGALDLSKLM